jgi:hypothetical protein
VRLQASSERTRVDGRHCCVERWRDRDRLGL